MNVHSDDHFNNRIFEKMKRYFIPILILLLTVTSGCARSKSDATVNDLFEEFSKVEDAEYINVNPFMMRMAGMAALFADSDLARITGKINSVKVLSLDKASDNDKRRLNQRISALNTDGYDDLITVNSDGYKVRVLARMDKDSAIRRLVVLCTDSSDCTLVSVKGKFSKDDINTVVNSTTSGNHGGK